MESQLAPRVIGERFQLVGDPLPGGALAQVYKAFDLQGEHGQVAVKLLALGSDPRARNLSFEREREALMRLDHPAVVPLLSSGVDAERDQPFLVMPWYGARLQEHLFAHGPMSWIAWWEGFGEPILGALEAAHRLEVEHRDLKPANVMLDGAHPKVIDFGIAKLHGLLLPEGTVDAASAPFTPPEPVAQSLPMTRDTHAWAALTVFALSGHDPYSAGEPYDRLAAARLAARAAVPVPVRPIVDACLSTRTADRPRSAMVLAAQLDAALERARRADGELAAASGPAVAVVARPALLDALEADLGLFSADVDDLLRRELSGPVSVLRTGEGRYRLACGSLSVRAAVDDGLLIALGAVAPDASTLDRERERGWVATVRFELGVPQDRQLADHALGELEQGVGEDEQRRRVQRQDDRARPFVVWRGLLALLRAHEAAAEQPRRYRSVGRIARGLRFTMAASPERDLVGEAVVAEASGGRDVAGVVAAVEDRDVIVHLEAGSPREPLPAGVLRRDRRAAATALQRQQRGLDAVEYRRSVRPDLGQLLAEPSRLREPVEVAVARFGQPLDLAKQRAVRAALGSEDVLIVRGPPGTGKTTFICELVVQEIARNDGARILIASQSHAALDHALSALDKQAPGARLLRLARADDERVADATRPLLLDAQLAEWKREASQAGQDELRKWAAEKGIDLRAVETATRMSGLAASLRQLSALEADRSRLEAELGALRSEHRQAAQGATSSQVMRERADELDELRVGAMVLGDQIREAFDRLVRLGELRRRTRRSSLDPEALEQRAAEVLPPDTPLAAECRRRLALLTDWHARFGLGSAFRAAAVARAQVVAATCVGLGGLRGADSLQFDLVIVDEASKATAPELMIPMARGRRVVLVGDEQQLPPYVEQEALSAAAVAERGLTLEELTQPLFGALVETAPEANVVTLSHQHRMHPAIGRLVSYCFYDRQLSSAEREPLSWLSMLAPRPVTWLTTAHLDERAERRAKASVVNRTEVQAIVAFLRTADGLARAARKRPTVAVLSGYAAQRDALEERIARERPTLQALSVECATVDAFQGRQADIVIYSLTRSNPRRQLGFVKERPRLNVALSRARDALIIVGDHAFARQARDSASLRRVLDHVDDHPDDCCVERARL